MRIISTWEELDGLETDEYYISVDKRKSRGYVRRKSDNKRMEYLSTHTFYKTNCKGCSKVLQRYGFDVQLKSWG